MTVFVCVSTGSFSFSILSGKIMFRDVVYVTQDLSFRWVKCFLCSSLVDAWWDWNPPIRTHDWTSWTGWTKLHFVRPIWWLTAVKIAIWNKHPPQNWIMMVLILSLKVLVCCLLLYNKSHLLNYSLENLYIVNFTEKVYQFACTEIIFLKFFHCGIIIYYSF